MTNGRTTLRRAWMRQLRCAKSPPCMVSLKSDIYLCRLVVNNIYHFREKSKQQSIAVSALSPSTLSPREVRNSPKQRRTDWYLSVPANH
ncbi:hypothetical protein M513_06754 [Trichuris suis]|uniref:Uncharacterized protein n=1 Tax=Trichuris suis TaxID=68888 RepID=A0A085M577_9BILA|nr:hypothetical protein M513_06754 [Trichuris suis]